MKMSNMSTKNDRFSEISSSDLEFEGIVIVGGGIAGLATAVALHRFGLKSLVLERADSLRTTGAALTLMTNAWRALDYLGVADSIRRQHPQLQRAQVTSVPSGFTKEVSYNNAGKFGNHEVRAVQRSVLLGTLAEELTPEWLGLQAPTLSGRSAVRGLATYPEGHKFEPKIQQYWGENLRAGFVPCNDKDVYWFTTQTSHPNDSEISQDPQRILEFAVEKLGNFPEPMVNMVKKSQIDTLTLAPLSLRWPWQVLLGRLSKGNVCVVGDAMHPMTPDLGQGGGATLEDAVVLGRCLGKAMTATDGLEDDKRIEEALNKFVEERRWRAFGLISGAYLTGIVQQGYGGLLMKFLRDKFLGRRLSDNILNQADFDCGELGAN